MMNVNLLQIPENTNKQYAQTNSCLSVSFLPCFCAPLRIWEQGAGILKSILPRSLSWSPMKLRQWELFAGGGESSGMKISVLYLLLPSVSLASVTEGSMTELLPRFWHQHPEILALPPPWLIYFLSLWFFHNCEHHINKII